MRFGHDWMILICIAAVPLCLLLLVWASRRRLKRYALWGEHALVQQLEVGVDESRWRLKLRLCVMALFMLLLTLLRPQVGEQEISALRKGVDIIVLMDTSTSMLAQDVKPSRLEKMKREVSALIDALEGDRIALIPFAGTSFVQCPLTTDKSMAKLLLSIVDTKMMPVQGTALAEALALARTSFVQNEKKHKALIVITDGEDHEGTVMEEARKAAEEGIVIYTIGVGELTGVPIPLVNDAGEVLGYKKTRTGDVVVTELNESVLKQIAAVTKGGYVHALSSSWNLSQIYEKVSRLDKKELESKKVTIYDEKYQWILIWVLILLGLEFCMALSKRKKDEFDEI